MYRPAWIHKSNFWLRACLKSIEITVMQYLEKIEIPAVY